jgi:peptidoglycan/xylan/chitin deacetylase (PgdA/CDA1 family)
MRDVLVLCYHAVSPSWEAGLSITPTALDRQLAYLTDQGWQPVTFAEAVLGTSPGRVLSITFDDAFASVREYAAPILQRYGAPATVFAPTAFMGGDANLVWAGIDHWQQTDHAGELKAMDWDDLGQLAGAGWEIGSHTRTHPWLTHLDDPALSEELKASRRECSERLGRPCQTIAYPYGDVDALVIAAAPLATWPVRGCPADYGPLGPTCSRASGSTTPTTGRDSGSKSPGPFAGFGRRRSGIWKQGRN